VGNQFRIDRKLSSGSSSSHNAKRAVEAALLLPMKESVVWPTDWNQPQQPRLGRFKIHICPAPARGEPGLAL